MSVSEQAKIFKLKAMFLRYNILLNGQMDDILTYFKWHGYF